MKNLFKWSQRQFSVIHNYHSPPKLFVGSREFTFDEKLNEYNKYIQAFLSKRFTHKKEITPKIKILDKVPGYHNSFYIQASYPFYTLNDISHLKFAFSIRTFDTGYFITRFFEDHEKPMYDAVFDKLLINGQVEFMEDKEKFDKLRSQIKHLISKFYNGDKLTPFEREIERAYLILKQAKYSETLIESRIKKEDCFLSYSERNKLSGHRNFRMLHPEYFFRPAPLYEAIDIDFMFKTLYEIRYNSLKATEWKKKLQLNYEYRPKMLQGENRTQFLSNYIFIQAVQYIDSYEFNEEFNLALNFKRSNNLLLLHLWFIIQKLRTINNEQSGTIIKQLIDQLNSYSQENRYKFEALTDNKLKIMQSNMFNLKILDFLSWHFYLMTDENKYNNLLNLVDGLFFERGFHDKYTRRLASYIIEHFKYFNNLSYEDIESSNFSFSVNRIPINYRMFVSTNDKKSAADYENLYRESESMKSFKEKILERYSHHKDVFMLAVPKKSDLSADDLIDFYGQNPIEDTRNYSEFDVTKSWLYRIGMFYRREFSTYSSMIGKEESRREYLKSKGRKDDIWDEVVDEKENQLGLKSLDAQINRRQSNLKR